VNERYFEPRHPETDNIFSSRATLALFFILGITLGCALAYTLETGVNSLLFSYLTDYISYLDADNISSPSLWTTLWEILRWPLFTGLFGTTIVGKFTTPTALILRGTLLSFTISVLIRFFGFRGFILSLAVLGIPALCSVITLFVVAYDISLFLKRRKTESENNRMLISHFLIVSALIPSAAFLHHQLSPVLLNLISGLFM